MQAIKPLLVFIVRLWINLFGQSWRRRWGQVLREAMTANGFDEIIKDIQTPRGTVRFYCLDALPLWRAETLLTKEPETIEWIDAMDDGSVFYDIGANVGAYTLYAGISRKVRVYAFEPLAANYFLLNRNIEENRLQDSVSAFCLAFNDEDTIGTMHVQDTGFGAAVSSFNDPVDHHGEVYDAQFLQGMVGMTLDSFIDQFDPEFPTHIKIDVDGIEDRIIAGASKTLADTRLKALSIELDEDRPDYTNAIIAAIEEKGLRLAQKRHAPMFEGTEYANIFNFHFRR